MDASEVWSSMRVAPRSVSVASIVSATIGVVDGRQIERFAADVLPHIELGPVADRKHAHMLAGVHARVVETPKLGPLVARVPLAELVAKGEHPLLGARLLLVAPGAADGGVEAEFADRFE